MKGIYYKYNMAKLYLGIEGGGSKSEALLVDEHDNIVFQRQGQALNLHSIGSVEFKNNLSSLLAPLRNKTDYALITAVLGLAGVDTPQDKTHYTMAIASVIPVTITFHVVNDAVIALAAKCPTATKRMIIICGTGASVYGENGTVHAKSIGWNHILGDEGSAYDIGKKVLKAATQSFDGRTEKTLLEKLVLQHSNAKNFDEFYTLVYAQKPVNEKFFIASFSPLLDKAIEKNDLIALQLREETVKELTRGINAVAKQLHMENDEFCLGLVGSTWNMKELKEMVIAETRKTCPHFTISNEDHPGVWGAIALAKRLSQDSL